MSIKDNIKKLNFAKQPETGESLAIPEFYANTIVVNVSPFEFEVQNLLAAQRQGSGLANRGLHGQLGITGNYTAHSSKDDRFRYNAKFQAGRANLPA
ncbi:MAG: hypothetical protein CVV45_01875 [Spirochaetae bacterium HGW-Spirochaetae-10]|nr:MAG: hypothetical protein CVV45_01875 [Spirochaetae bacterium HGW-Spirochaetae-10]